MTNNGWGSEWPSTGFISEIKTADAMPAEAKFKDSNSMLNWLNDKNLTLKRQGSNFIDNNCHLYFQCEGCDTILDPNTKSFRMLQEHRVNAGWKCVWNMNGLGYKVYCGKCGEKVNG